MTETPGSDNRIDYVMMRMPKLFEDAEEEMKAEGADDGSENVAAGNEGMSFALHNALNFAKSQAPTRIRNNSMRSTQGTINNLRMSVKVNLRSTESKLLLKNLNLLTKQRSSDASEEEKRGLDMEESKQRQNLMENMMQTR